MKLLDKKTAGDTVRLGIFIVVTTLATALLAITIGNISFGATNGYKAVFSDATGVVKGDDVRIAGVKVGTVKGVEILRPDPGARRVRRRRRQPAHREHLRHDPLPQPGRPALHRADRGHGRPGRARGGRHDPAGPDQPGARPDRAVQRLQAAVRRADPRGRQPAVLRADPGLPGRGRHHREPARQHGVGHQHARRARRADRRPDREPQHDAGDRRRPRRAAVGPHHPVPHVHRRAEPRTGRRSSARWTRSPTSRCRPPTS